jgi:DNA-binding NarL/FixJ family response regulator
VTEAPTAPRVIVLADDLIWQTRLVGTLQAIGADAARARGDAELDDAFAGVDAVVVDLTARTYDPIRAIEQAVAAGRRVLAVGQHDDAAQRKRALAAGAEKVYAYRKLFEDGPATLATWLGAAALGIQKRYR